MKYYGEDMNNRWIDCYLDGTLEEKRQTAKFAIQDAIREAIRRLGDLVERPTEDDVICACNSCFEEAQDILKDMIGDDKHEQRESTR
jgi:hypothetical protein